MNKYIDGKLRDNKYSAKHQLYYDHKLEELSRKRNDLSEEVYENILEECITHFENCDHSTNSGCELLSCDDYFQEELLSKNYSDVNKLKEDLMKEMVNQRSDLSAQDLHSILNDYKLKKERILF